MSIRLYFTTFVQTDKILDRMKEYLLYLLPLCLLFSCSDYKFPEDKTVSENNGAVADSEVSYLPNEIDFAGTKHTFDWDKKIQTTIDSYYSFTSEPILYNFYLGRQIYRFVLEKEGKSPLIISINIDGGKAWVISKRIYEKEQIAEACGIKLVREYDHFTRELSKEDVATFQEILYKANIYQLVNVVPSRVERDYCLIEAHDKGKYWTAYRSLLSSEIKELVDFIVPLTRFNTDMDKQVRLDRNIIIG